MLRELFGSSTITSQLRGGLEEASVTHKAIAARVAATLPASSSTDFAAQLESSQARAQRTQADLETDMTQLADTQLRYEADAKLLQAAYGRIRAAVSERA